MSRERRFVTSLVEARAASDGAADAPTIIAGYGAVFGSPTNIGDYFIEEIAPGAFTAAIGRDDVRGLFNHDQNLILGRNKAGTLRLSEDDKGLAYEIDAPDTSAARDLMVSLKRGDVTQSSFCFIALREEWDDTGDLPKRTILEAELLDVGPVTFAAYEDSEAGCRSAADVRDARLKPAPAALDTAAAALKRQVEIDLRARSLSRPA